MNRLKLEYDALLQGDFKVGKLNFLFAFQVNCPGCFFYGFPVVNELYHKHNGAINFLGLSTAFEDFEFNTRENTTLLLNDKKLVGETKKALNEQGYQVYPQNIDFPIAMDRMQNKADFISDENIESICRLNPNYDIWPDFEQKQLHENIEKYLEQQSNIPSTFTLNQFRGTPTFVVFNEEYSVLEHWFGHKTPQEINEILNKWL